MRIDPQPWTRDLPFLSPWDLQARGRPGPGPDFIRYADADGGLADLRARLKLKDYDGPEGKRRLQEEIASREPAFRATVDDEYRRALYEGDYTLNIEYRGKKYPDVPFVRGGLWGAKSSGPMDHARSDVMVIGKLPGKTEIRENRNFCGPSSVDLLRACKKCDIPSQEYLHWYMTNLVRFDRPDEGAGALPKPWIADCLSLLWEELVILRPKHILCLGSEAIKALMGTSHNVSNMAGRMLPLTYRAAPAGRAWSTYDELEEHTAIVMCVVHPAYVYRQPVAFDELVHGVAQFHELCRGRIDADTDETGVRHMAVYSEAVLSQIVDAIRARPGHLTVAFDAEWHGKHWDDEDAYLRTIQFAPAWKESYCVVLNDVGGTPIFRPSADAAIAQLRRLVSPKDDGIVRVGGHAFRADMPWLIKSGLDLRPFFDVPEDWDPKVMPTGFDTLYLAHAAHESLESFKLESLAMRYTSCPRWDVELQAWKDYYCKKNNLKDRDLEGYGMCPEDILIPYSNYDADATRRLADIFWGHCIEDKFHTDPTTGRGLDSRPAYLNSMQAWLGFLEMELGGIVVDVERAETLIKLYAEKTAQLKDYMRQVLNWPDFNPRSTPQCRELLFGEALNGTLDKLTGEPRVLRPPGAMDPLHLTPIKTTTKPPRQWSQVVADGTWTQYTASTDKETLGILAHDHEIVRLLCDIRFIGQVVNTVLRPPKMVKKDNEAQAPRARIEAISDNLHVANSGDVRTGRVIELDDFGPPPGMHDDEDEEAIYDGGFLYYMNSDGRVRTHFYAAETRRCTSSRPNCQCFAKQRDADYQRILGYHDDKRGEVATYKDVFGSLCYKYPIRTICRAAPGCVLLEWDLKSAEIAMLAWEADDEVMIDDVRRAMLPEDHPDYIDLHVATAISAFRLDCPPTKQGLEDLGLLHLRTPAKNVRFGVPYGRSAGAIARQCREQGAPVSERDSQMLIDGWHARYRKGSAFLARCAARPRNQGWMAGPYLGYRRFPETSDQEVLKNMEREAQNFTIQNGVADMISLAIYNLRRYRDANQSEGTFRLVLQIHDALILEVPIAHVPWVFDCVLPACVESVEIIPRDLDGRDNILQGRPPYHFDLDKELYVNWGEKLAYGENRNNLIKAGLDPKYLPREKPSKK
jgi:uracil-DNA glycosylase family 4